MKKLIIIILLGLLAGCATGKQAAPGYTIVETTKEYTVYKSDKTGELHKVDASVMNCKYEKNNKNASKENTEKGLSWAFRTLTSPNLIP